MGPQELANEQLTQQREVDFDTYARAARRAAPAPELARSRACRRSAMQRVTTGDGGADEYVAPNVPCPRCGTRDTTYAYVRGVRDIGKSETWGNKDAADVLLRFRCPACEHVWESETVG